MNHSVVQQKSASLAAWLSEIPEPKLEEVLHTAVASAARGLADFVGRPIHLSTFQVEAVPVARITRYAGDPEAGMVGIYLLLEGDLRGQAILIMPLDSARALASVLVDTLPDTANVLGDLERSALAEVGNVMVSYFLNAVAGFLRRPRPLYPSPPAVMVDMLGAILDVVAAPAATESDNLLIVACGLSMGRMESHQRVSMQQSAMQVHFWVLPDTVAAASSAVA